MNWLHSKLTVGNLLMKNQVKKDFSGSQKIGLSKFSICFIKFS